MLTLFTIILSQQVLDKLEEIKPEEAKVSFPYCCTIRGKFWQSCIGVN